ncbi:MAG: excisionase family DNA binding protein [Crocinitomix sp.]|jgi:excisionase family DNA binding protein
MNINNVISNYTPKQLAAFLVELDSGGFKIDLNIKIEKELSNELSTKQAAKMLGVSTRHVYNLANEGKIKSMKILGRNTYYRDNIQGALDAGLL